MANKAVFVDRDNTLIEDPGYLSDPADLKFLPGVDLALRSLIHSDYKVIVVTNQSGVARGMLTEERLQEIHEELRRQLALKKLHLDGIYTCPYHPDGTVERYARESELRKPNPGMLLKAAEDLDVDLDVSWMVGDSPRDVAAGKRAGCKTIRIQLEDADDAEGADEQETQEDIKADEAKADFTVRNFVDATRVVLRHDAGVRIETETLSSPSRRRVGGHVIIRHQSKRKHPAVLAPEDEYQSISAPGEDMSDQEIQRGILRELYQLNRSLRGEKFNITKMLAGLCQVLALMCLCIVIYQMTRDEVRVGMTQLWGTVTVVLQVMALTLFLMQRGR